MKVGVFYFPTDYGIRADELAATLEARGFESLFVCEHTHIPTSRRSPFPSGGPIQERYKHTDDPFVALSFAAAATKKLLLGTGICLVIERDPIVTAKEVASLDHLSGGRFLFGIGGGWNAEEMEDHGTAFKTRFRVLRERILAMKEIWTRDEAEYHGQFVSFDKMWSFPKPAQKPHPPILMGGDGPTTLDRVLEYADGWMPVAGRMGPAFLEKVTTLQRRAKEMGRGPVPVTAFMVQPDRAVLDPLQDAGIVRVIFAVPSE